MTYVFITQLGSEVIAVSLGLGDAIHAAKHDHEGKGYEPEYHIRYWPRHNEWAVIPTGYSEYTITKQEIYHARN